MLYGYADYEEAYYHGRVYQCKEIGCYLLSKLVERNKDKKAKKLLEKLSKIEYSWDAPKRELKHITKVLLEVKIWLMINF